MVEPRPEAECSFHAISWHQLLFARAPFNVTELGLPVTGSGSRSAGHKPLPVLAALAGLGVMASLAGYLRWGRTRS